MTSIPCPRRGAHQLGSSSWVRRQSVQRARRGVRRARRPSSRRHHSGPGRAPPRGKPSPPRRTTSTPAAARPAVGVHSLRVQVQQHAGTAFGVMPGQAARPRPAGEGGVRVAPCPTSDRLASRPHPAAPTRHRAQPRRPPTSRSPATTSSVVTLSSHTNRSIDSPTRPARGERCAPLPTRTRPAVIIRSVGQQMVPASGCTGARSFGCSRDVAHRSDPASFGSSSGRLGRQRRTNPTRRTDGPELQVDRFTGQ